MKLTILPTLFLKDNSSCLTIIVGLYCVFRVLEEVNFAAQFNELPEYHPEEHVQNLGSIPLTPKAIVSSYRRKRKGSFSKGDSDTDNDPTSPKLKSPTRRRSSSSSEPGTPRKSASSNEDTVFKFGDKVAMAALGMETGPSTSSLMSGRMSGWYKSPNKILTEIKINNE